MFRKCCMRPACHMPEKGCNKHEVDCPIVEPTINNCIEKEFCHEVKHICPIHTHVINKHIFNHTFTPQFSCSEEDQIVDNNPGCSGMFQNNGF